MSKRVCSSSFSSNSVSYFFYRVRCYIYSSMSSVLTAVDRQQSLTMLGTALRHCWLWNNGIFYAGFPGPSAIWAIKCSCIPVSISMALKLSWLRGVFAVRKMEEHYIRPVVVSVQMLARVKKKESYQPRDKICRYDKSIAKLRRVDD